MELSSIVLFTRRKGMNPNPEVSFNSPVQQIALFPTWNIDMARKILLAVLVVIAPMLSHAAEVREIVAERFTAYILPVGHEDRITIRRFDPRDIAEFSLLSRDNQHGGHVEKAEWSPDRKFFVFSSTSSGGHSPWNCRTYVFSTERWEFLSIDDSVSPVVTKDFTFTDSTHLQINALRTPSSQIDDSEVKVVDLEELPWTTPKKVEP